jgi:hypothetical protein
MFDRFRRRFLLSGDVPAEDMIAGWFRERCIVIRAEQADRQA